MGRECNPIFRENSGLERLPFELAESVDEIEETEIESPRSAAFHRFHARLRRRKPNQRYPVKNVVNENEEKNEILSRTVGRCRRLLRVVVYWVLFALILSAMSVDAAASFRSSSYVDKRLTGYQRPNKNCKEFDVTSRAYLADLIFEGTARTRSPAHGQGSRYEVTFVIQNILKQHSDAVRLSRKSQIRLHFGQRGRRRPETEQCSVNRVKNKMRLAKANVKTGGTYFVFAHQANPINYTAMGEPIVNNWRNRKSIESVISRKGRQPHVLGLQNVSLGASAPLRLSCQVRGLPVPRITWTKDGTLLIPTSRTHITYYRKNSTLEIASARSEDSGRYTCRGTSVIGVAAVTVHVNVTEKSSDRTPRPDDSDWPNHAEKCQVDTFCLNGGSCRFITFLSEHTCICAPGFTGARCEQKDVSRGTSSILCGFNVGYSLYYC